MNSYALLRLSVDSTLDWLERLAMELTDLSGDCLPGERLVAARLARSIWRWVCSRIILYKISEREGEDGG